MFKYIKTLYFSDKGKCVYNIIDDNFIICTDVKYASDLLGTVVSVYNNKNLNVPKNIVRFLKWCATEYSDGTISHILFLFKDNVNYIQYKEEIFKYLMLL